ncbi:thioredoxin domain-containing protein [Aquirufa rosea]|uniref:Thioredoxin 1 n=1 Tax=Aquirufa rosea TaxID=2509241 RepID=A0A4Q1BX91_9BACT|nr:thioredoxin domain-containing protein [Aquirufa rosea]RXK46818.1 thioredoxin 1 [Aquirufa rosea]
MKAKIVFYSFLIFSLFFSFQTIAQSVEVEVFEKKIQENPNAILLDVRTSGEFGGGHLPKATNIDFRSADFAEQIRKLPKEKPVLIYCLSGGRSAQAAELMRKEGFQVTELKGGYLKWTTKLKPLEGVPAVAHDKAWDMADFTKKVQGQKAVVVDFYAKWCAPCLKMMPIVDKLSQEYTGKVTVLKVEADGNQAILQSFGIDEIPSFLVFQGGKLLQKTSGFREEAQLKELFDQSIGTTR